jgi:hypothetical protein
MIFTNGDCQVLIVEKLLTQANIKRVGFVDNHGVGVVGGHGSMPVGGQVVALVVKQRARAAGLDPRAYASHSLRAGLAAAAARAGIEERDIMRQTGHRSERTIRNYIREGQLFRNNASSCVGL